MNIHDLYRPFEQCFRTKRMQKLYHVFRINNLTRVLDIGGDFLNWTLISILPSLTITNIYSIEKRKNRIAWDIAGGRYLPFKDGSFDIAYSNSVIEHLGNFKNQQTFARELMRVGVNYFVQTPNKRFPLELHLLTLFIHWIPHWQQK